MVILTANAAVVHAQDGVPSSDEAVAIFNQGQDAHEKGDLKKAVELYQNALKILPEFPEAEYQRGLALASLGQLPDAEFALRRAVELREDWTLAINALGSLLIREGKFDEADGLLNRAVSLDASNAPAYVALVDLRLHTKATPQTLNELLVKLRDFTSKASPTASLWTARSKLEAALDNLRDAKTSVEAALAIDPKNRDALFQRANLALAANEVELAESIANSLGSSSVDSDELALLKAKVALASGRDDDAAKLLAAVRSPNAETDKLRRIVDANRSKSPAEFESLLKADPKNASVLGRLCTLYRVSDPAKALDFCSRAHDVDPSNISYATGYAAALVQAKRYSEATVLLTRIIAASPDSLSAHANLATALFQQKQFQAAKAEYHWLIARQPDLPIAYFFLAICHDQLGEYLDAGANYQIFLKTADPEKNRIEIEKVNLRLPAVLKLIKNSKGGGNDH